MATTAEVLTLSQQKKSLSSKKKKKVAVKNVLGLPKSLRVESFVIDDEEGENLKTLLQRLLPSAKLPRSEKPKGKDGESEETKMEDPDTVKQAKLNRHQLVLGVNDLNRSIKKNLIAAVIMASDISPKFLVHHLNVLCKNSQIPFVHIPHLREVTRTSLGFQCIALGFKKGSKTFGEAIMKVKSVAKLQCQPQGECGDSESDSDSSNSDGGVTQVSDKGAGVGVGTSESSFKLLYRSSVKERIFNPDECKNVNPSPKRTESEFITIDNEDDDDDADSNRKSSESVKRDGWNKGHMLRQKSKAEMSDSDDEYKVPKKKKKKEQAWTIDKVGDKRKVTYSPANIIKVHSNENRPKKKKK